MTSVPGVLMLGRGRISHILTVHDLFENLLLYTQALIRQTKYILMMTEEGSAKIVNFMTP